MNYIEQLVKDYMINPNWVIKKYGKEMIIHALAYVINHSLDFHAEKAVPQKERCDTHSV